MNGSFFIDQSSIILKRKTIYRGNIASVASMDATPLLSIDKEHSLMIILYCLLTTLNTNQIPLNKQLKIGYFMHDL